MSLDSSVSHMCHTGRKSKEVAMDAPVQDLFRFGFKYGGGLVQAPAFGAKEKVWVAVVLPWRSMGFKSDGGC